MWWGCCSFLGLSKIIITTKAKSQIFDHNMSSGPYIAGGGGGRGGAVPLARKTFFFSNIVFDFFGLVLIDVLVRNLKKTD